MPRWRRHLSLEKDPSEFGDSGPPPLPLKAALPVKNSTSISGEVVHVDRFGNIITNIRWIEIGNLGDFLTLKASVKDKKISFSSGSYSSVPINTLVALEGSSGFLEIAKRGGSAGETLAAAPGDRVLVGLFNRKAEEN